MSRPRILLVGLLVLTLSPGGATAARLYHLGKRFALTSPQGYVGLGYERRDQEREIRQAGGGFGKVEESQSVFSEELDLETHGYFYHPRFLIFDLEGLLELEQTEEEVNRGTAVDNDALFQTYRADLTFLQSHPYTVNLYANRTNGRIDSPFAEQQESTAETQGARLFLKRHRFPTTLTLQHSILEQTGNFDSEEERIEARAESFYRGESSDGRLTYDFLSRDATILTETLVSHRVRLVGNARLDPEHAGTAGFSAGVHDQSGGADVRSSDASGHFHWEFTDRLHSDTRMLVDKQKFLERELLRVGGQTALSHELFESLTTTATAYGERQFVDETGRDDETGGSLDLNYRKRIPGGSLVVSLRGARSYNIEEGLGGRGRVSEEPHTIPDAPHPAVVFLDRVVDLTEPVVVTDASGFIQYDEGFDYQLDLLGSTLRIAALAGGQIAPGQEILVSYAFQGQPDATFFTNTTVAGVRFNFHSGLSLYGRQIRTTHELRSGSAVGDRLSASTTTAAGVSYERGPSRSSFAFEDYDRASNAYRRWQVDQSLVFHPRPTIGVSLAAGWSLTELDELGESFQAASATGRVNWVAFNLLRLLLATTYSIQEQVGDTITRLRTEFDARVRFRAFETLLTGTYDLSESEVTGQRTDSQLTFRIRRYF